LATGQLRSAEVSSRLAAGQQRSAEVSSRLDNRSAEVSSRLTEVGRGWQQVDRSAKSLTAGSRLGLESESESQ